MPDPAIVIKRSLVLLARRGYSKELSATIVFTVIVTARQMVATVYPGALPWFQGLEDELIAQAGVAFDIRAIRKDGQHDNPIPST